MPALVPVDISMHVRSAGQHNHWPAGWPALQALAAARAAGEPPEGAAEEEEDALDEDDF